LGRKLSPRQLELYRAIDEVLWREWDPIGVAKFGTEARDEYQGYLPQVFQFALRGDEGGMSEYLTSITTEQMGLAPRPEADRSIAARIMKIRASIGPEEAK